MAETKFQSIKKMLKNNKQAGPLIAIAVLLLFLGGVVTADKMGYLKGMFSDASCYGYGDVNCNPNVKLRGKVYNEGYGQKNKWSSGKLVVSPGSRLILDWQGNDVQSCVAEGGWSSSTESSHTEILQKAIARSRTFTVTCYDKITGAYVNDTLSVIVNQGPVGIPLPGGGKRKPPEIE